MAETMVAPTGTRDRWAARRRRAAALAERFDFAAEPLALYAALLDARGAAYEGALRDRPDAGTLPRYAVERVLPAVMDATMEAGPELLREATLLRFHDGDLEEIVARWLRGEDLAATDRYLARAAAGPLLEALPDAAAKLKDEDAAGCPTCGAAPQLAYWADTGDALVTAPRYLGCSRCAREWVAPRMTCAFCGENTTQRLPILSAAELFPHQRVDACETCKRFVITTDLRKDAAAVPEVDEIAAIPLALAAQERGFAKTAPNLLGF